MNPWYRIAVCSALVFLTPVALTEVLPPAEQVEVLCRDDWKSPSIGAQGACSWHGGIKSNPTSWRFWAVSLPGAFAAIALFLATKPNIPPRRPRTDHRQWPRCQACGAPMMRAKVRSRKRSSAPQETYLICSKRSRCPLHIRE